MNTQEKVTPDVTINEIISTRPRAVDLIASLGMNPERYSDDTLRSVCQQRQWNEVELVSWINKHLSTDHADRVHTHEIGEAGDSIERWGQRLSNEIVKQLELMNQIIVEFPRVHQIHGNQYTWLKDAAASVKLLHDRFQLYVDFERKKLLPLARELNESKGEVSYGLVRKLRHGFRIIESDQTEMRSLMNKISHLSRGFRHPEGGCSTLRILNQTFMELFEGLNRQFDMETKTIVPLLDRKIQAL